MQTYLVHNRHPVALLRDLGWRNFLFFQLYVGSLIVSSLIHTVFALSLGVAVLQHGLHAKDADIEGIGTSTLTIHGVEPGELHATDHAVVPDRIQAATYLAAVAEEVQQDRDDQDERRRPVLEAADGLQQFGQHFAGHEPRRLR